MPISVKTGAKVPYPKAKDPEKCKSLEKFDGTNDVIVTLPDYLVAAKHVWFAVICEQKSLVLGYVVIPSPKEARGRLQMDNLN